MMLYQIGLLSFDTGPFPVDRLRRRASADFAVKPVIGGLKPREPMGEGDDQLTLEGKLLPFRLGGATELEIADGMRIAQVPHAVMRGDGKAAGYFVIEDIEEDHSVIVENGVGFVIDYRITIQKVPPPNLSQAVSAIGALTSLFAVLTG